MKGVTTSRAGTDKINPVTFNRLLIERGLTQTEFSRLAGVSKMTLASIQRGEALRADSIAKIAAALEGIAPRPLIHDLLEKSA